MSEHKRKFENGYQAFQRNDYDAAKTYLTDCDHPQAQHLLGIVERRLGNLVESDHILSLAAKKDPQNPEIAHNRGLVSMDQGDLTRAENHFKEALALAPGFVSSAQSLGRLYIREARWHEARSVYEDLLRRKPNSPVAHHGMGTVELELGECSRALARFDQLLAQEPRAEFHFMRGRCLMELGRPEDAQESLRRAFAESPDPMTFKLLGNLLWMRDHEAEFRALLDDAAQYDGLNATRLELMRLADMTLSRGTAGDPDSLSVLANGAIDEGEAEPALALSEQALLMDPGHGSATAAQISALLMLGEFDRALRKVREKRLEEPLGQHWIAYESIALRFLDPAAYQALVDVNRWVQDYELPVPPGYENLEAFNREFAQVIKGHHVYARHPLGQSLRQGSQTPCDLLTIDHPVVRAYRQALDEPIRQYLAEIGSHSDHPLTARNAGDYRFAGCWSVVLAGQGKHVNHVHPEGWISSAYYVQVPAEVADSKDRRGWIKFGEPPFAMPDRFGPERWVQPRNGTIVLFPSYLWHGTVPILDGSVRITAPFDLLPN